jgi:thiol:disulfide interchange protein DsbD
LANRLLLGVLASLALAAAPGAAAAQPGANPSGTGLPVQTTPAPARTGAQRVDAVEVELVGERLAASSQGLINLGLRIAHRPGWHTYWRNSGDSGLPTTIAPQGPEGTVFGPIRWPAPERLRIGPLANYGFEGEIVLPFEARLPVTTSQAGGSATRVEVHAQWLVCKDVCIPGEARLAIELPRADAGVTPGASLHAPLFAAMAERTPAPPPMPARLHRHEDGLSLSFAWPGGTPARAAEFFPYSPGIVSAPAPQRLLSAGDGARIDLQRGEPGPLPPVLEGVVRIDGRVFELSARATDAAPPIATLISVAGDPVPPLTGATSVDSGRLLSGQADRPAGDGSMPDNRPGEAAGLAAGGPLPWLLAALGGLLLNLMPCVFPVVGLKVLGFAGGSPDTPSGRRAMRLGGGAFGAGVLVSFWLLGGLMLALRAAGEAIGWGFQLQSPGFVAALALLFVAIGLNFSGVYEFGLTLTRLGGVGVRSNSRGPSLAGSFGAGVLAVLVATPCTAPFMGSTLGLTLSQPAAQSMLSFTAIGAGMALPYVLLGLFPTWLSWLPRPGRWMETLRQILAFPMYASAAWLAWVLTRQAGADALLRLLLATVLLGMAAWAWGRFSVPPRPRRALAASLVIACLVGATTVMVPIARESGQGRMSGAPGASGVDGRSPDGLPADSVTWQAWSEAAVRDALAQGRPVFVDFTAAWCVTCQVNKQWVLDRPATRELFTRHRVLALRADWTQQDADIARELARHGRNGVPLYLVHRPDRAGPQVLPELLTPAIVKRSLE